MKNNSWITLIIFILLCEAVGIAGSFFTISNIPGWYAGLVKPSFNPPSWIFGPVWTTLYLLMGIAGYLLWRKRGEIPQAKKAFAWFFIQLALNSIWTPIFFGAHRLGVAFGEIVLLWIAILVTIAIFWRAIKSAALLLIPYAVWVTFAAVLNFALWRLNS